MDSLRDCLSGLFRDMHRTRILLFTFLLLNTCTAAVAQPSYRASVRRYGLEDGLPHRQVSSITEDQRGFIWVATAGGVVRFDGRRFKVFNQSESGLGSDEVNWVSTDRDGHIWARGRGADAWLRIIEPVSGKVIPADTFFHNHPLPLPPSAWDWPPLKIQDGSFIINLLDSACFMRYHPDQGWQVVHLPEGRAFYVSNMTPRNTLWGIHTDRQEKYTLLETDLQGHVLNRIPAFPDGHFWLMKGETTRPGGFFVKEGLDLKPGTIWEIEDTGHRTFVAPGSLPLQYARIKNGDIDIHFPKIYDRNGQLLLDLSQQFPEIDQFQYFDYLLDRNGNIWFATAFGLFVIEMRKTHFRKLLYDEKAPGGRGKACRGLLEKNGRLIVNTELGTQGRFLIDPRSGEAQRIPGEMVIGIAESSDGNVWTNAQAPNDGFAYASLQKITPEGQPVPPSMDQKRVGGHIWTILEDNPRRVLLGHTIGASVYDPTTGILIPWHDDAYPEFDQSAISWLCKDRAGRVWACTSGGLYSFQANGRVAERFWPEGKGRHYLPYSKIYHFYEDQEGIIWLGTGGGGLIRWDRKAPEGQQVQVIFRKNGLINGVVYAVYEDKHEHLWLPTDYGIAQLDKKTLQVRRTWLVADGLTHNEFNRVSHCQGADGSLYFGGLNGVTTFHPDEFYAAAPGEGKTRQSLVVSDFSVWDDGSDQLVNRTAQLLASNTFTLYPGNRYADLEFALLEYMVPEKVTYTWKLEGVSTDWQTLKDPVLRLSSLPYGSHHLLIRAQAADGSLAENELDILLRVMPPIYLRWWFIVLAVFLLALGIWAWLRWRIREHRQEQERLEQEVTRQTATIRHQTEELEHLDQIKSRFFANVSHELRTPLTLLLGPITYALNDTGLSQQSKKLLEAARRNSLHLQQLVNEILDISKLRATGLDLHEQPTVLFDFLEETLSVFQSLAESRSILLKLEYLPDPAWTLALDRQKLLKILSNLLSNALKYAPNHSTVVLQVEKQAGDVVFWVQDEGPGIHPDDLPYIFDLYYQSKRPENKAEGGTGIGLALARELSQAMGGSVWAESQPGKGSVFFLRLPAQERSPEQADGIARSSPPDEAFGSPVAPPAAPEPAISAPVARLLVVEDNTDLQTFLRAILPSEYHLTAVGNGRAALDYLSDAERLPDLILTDVMMPEMDGFQLLEALRHEAAWRPIPVILLTALAASDDRLRAFRIGIDDYITKPFSAEELIVRIDNALRNQASRREWQETEPGVPAETEENTDAWLLQLRETARQNLSNPEFDIDYLSERMGISRRTLSRQIRQRAGLSANQLIQELRLLQARELIETGQYRNLRLVAEAVGLRSANYLSRLYRERFGNSPADDL